MTRPHPGSPYPPHHKPTPTILHQVSRFLDKEAWQKPARQLLLWLSVADLFTAIIYMVPAQDGPYCTVQSLVGMYFPIASFLLTDCIAYFVYLIVCDQYHGYKRWRLLRSALLPCWSALLPCCPVALLSCCPVALPPFRPVLLPPFCPPALFLSRIPTPLRQPPNRLAASNCDAVRRHQCPPCRH